MKYYNGTFLKICSHARFKAQFFLKLGVYFQVHSIQKQSKNGGKEILCLIRHCEEFYASLHSRKSMLCAYIWVAWLRSILLYLMQIRVSLNFRQTYILKYKLIKPIKQYFSYTVSALVFTVVNKQKYFFNHHIGMSTFLETL